MDGARGGAERVLATITAALAEGEHDVSLLTFDREGGSPFYPLSPKIRYHRLALGNAASSTTVSDALQRIPALRTAIVSERPDVVVSFMHSMFIPCAVALMHTGIPLVASEHIVPAHYRGRPLERSLLLATTPLVTRYTVLSDAVRRSYPRFMQPKMVPLPNPVESPRGTADPHGKGPRFRILTVGRLDPQKDQRTLIIAFARLCDRYPDWDLRIVGDGPLRSDLENLIRSLGAERRIILGGTTPDIGSEYRAAQLFVMPSLYESFGLATAEALSYGLPAIGFLDCPGTNELITDGTNGLLVDGSDRVSALMRGLETLMRSPELRVRFGEAGRRDITARYSTDHVVSEWEKLLAEARTARR